MKNSRQLTMAVTPDHRNQYLFSDHYWTHMLRRDPRWDAALPQAETFLAWLQALYADERDQLPEYNENQLENHWFKPILAQLGHVFETQASVPGLDHRAKRPDYVFFPDEAARQQAAGLQNEKTYSDQALTVGEVKRWDTPLGKKRKGGGPSFDDQNPSWQIDYYVRATGLDWGILTNGRLWRLVHADTSQRLAIYYEVDLVELLERGDADALRYFVLFFRQAAFRPDEQGRVFLDDALAASHAYAVALEGDLEKNVYRALECLMQGFLDLPANDLGADDIQTIYDNSLYLLYRLLFILYGESRGLLPMDNDQYREYYSLQSIERRIADDRVPISALTTVLWANLNTLFHIINGDDAELNRSLGVPRYNGGLFDPQQHPFLTRKAVGDQALGEAIDLLSRRETNGGREFVDYRSLGVRHLGSIYEGLLEYRPRIANDERNQILPLRLWKNLVSKRKSTGSYYTPQYIVEYIVEHTLGPLVEDAREKANLRMSESANGESANRQTFVEAILNLKVLDPAMGSGHFLVEATEFLALKLATDPHAQADAPVAEEDLVHWKRRVVERCIYGVDKNPLAVELAKLSLWLATVAAGRPLSFLNHHLKCGDSLVGARVDDLGEAPPVMSSKKVLKERKARYEAGARQANLFETRLTEKLPVVMGRILEITEVESKDYDTVRAKDAADRAVRELKLPFETAANLWISAYFGNEFINGEYDEALMQIGQPDALLALDAVQRAQAMADERHFFHWELAFPEVFYDERGQRLGERAGFDAVVGNPPYLVMENMVSDDRDFYYSKRPDELPFFETAMHKSNLYSLFWEKDLELVRIDGWCGLITPYSWLSNSSFLGLRTLFLGESRISKITLLPLGVFDAGIATSITVAQRQKASDEHCVKTSDLRQLELQALPDALYKNLVHKSIPTRVFRTTTDSVFNLDWNPIQDSILRKAEGKGIALQHFCSVDRGCDTANNEKFMGYVFDSQQNPKKLLRGETFDRYDFSWDGLYLYYLPNQMVAKKSTARPGEPERFERAKKLIVYRFLDQEKRFIVILDAEQYYSLGSTYVVALEPNVFVQLAYIMALLNSRLMALYNSHLFAGVKVTLTELLRLPIRRIDFTTPAGEREQLTAEAKAKSTQSISALASSGAVGSDTPMDRIMLSQAASPALDFVAARLDQEPEQADVIHDLLAHLAERMIEMNKQKRTRTETFWLDMEGVTDAETFGALHNHGKWERTLWHESKACRPFVDQESRSTRRLDESLAWNEAAFKSFVKTLAGRIANLSDVIGVYRKHHDDLQSLARRIEATDWLIDQIVYKLYGLTKDEIAIVEEGD